VSLPTKATTILLLGETGAGKTSFLNLLRNFPSVLRTGSVNQADFRDLHHESNSSLTMHSKTEAVTPHEIRVGGLPLVVVDTPGLGDTRGPEVDAQQVAEIVHCVSNLGAIDAIVIVICGRNSKMTTQLKYVLSQLRKILGNAACSNIVLVFTNAVDELYVNFDAACLASVLEQEVSPERQIFVENPFVLWERRSANGCSIEPKVQQKLAQQFDLAQRNLSKFFRAVLRMPCRAQDHNWGADPSVSGIANSCSLQQNRSIDEWVCELR